MSVTHKFIKHLYLVLNSWEDYPHYAVYDSPDMEDQNSEHYTYEYVRPLEQEVVNLTDPKTIDQKEFRLRGIRRAQRKLMADYQKQMNELKAVEQSLLAITNEAEDAE